MAQSKTPFKRAKQAEKNRLRNKSYKSRLKTYISKYESSLTQNDPEKARELLLQVTSYLDKSVNKGILHKNTAARKNRSLPRNITA